MILRLDDQGSIILWNGKNNIVGAQYTVLPNLAQLEEATQSRSGENCIFRPIAAGLLDFQSEGVL